MPVTSAARSPIARAVRNFSSSTTAAMGKASFDAGSTANGSASIPPESSGCAQFGHFIGGKQRYFDDAAPDWCNVVSPVTNKPISRFPNASPGHVESCVDAADEALRNASWARDRTRRFRALQRMGDALRKPEHIAALAKSEVAQIGRPLREMQFQLGRLGEWFEYYAALLRVHENAVKPFSGSYINYVERVPLGVVAQITPWNHPLLITVKKMAPALAAGNAVVIKPSELAPNSVITLAEILTEACNGEGDDELLPPGILNVILGDGKTGAALVSDPRISKVDFTGGTETGRVIGAAAGRNLAGYIAELGGKSPMLVFDPRAAGSKESDESVSEYLDNVVNGCVFGTFIASGQTCVAGTRLLLQRSIKDAFLAKLVKKVQSELRVGDPLKAETGLGPVITSKQLSFIENVVADGIAEGAEVLCGGKRKTDFPDNPSLASGNFYEPTILYADSHDNPVFQTEMFGPVLSVTCFDDEAGAISLANGTPYGLGCSIWSPNLPQAHSVANKIDAGIIWINDHHKNDPSSPWGGLKKASGLGRENGLDAFHEYTQAKSIVVNCEPYKSDWFGNLQTRYN